MPVDVKDLLEKIEARSRGGGAEVLYFHARLLDDLFARRYDITDLVRSFERTKGARLRFGAGLAGGLWKLLQGSVGVEGGAGRESRVVVEQGLTPALRTLLCEVSLEDAGLLVENPERGGGLQGKYLRLVDRLQTIAPGEDARLTAELGDEAADAVLARWRRDQALTPGQPQVALVAGAPVPCAAVVAIQQDVQGSTYLAGPPAPGASRSVLCQPLDSESGVTFLKVYSILDLFAE